MRRSALRVATLEEVAHYGSKLPRGLMPPMAGGAGVPPAEYATTVVGDSPVSYWRRPYLDQGLASPTFQDQMNVAALTGWNPSTNYSRAPGALSNDSLGAMAGWSGSGTSSEAHNTTPPAGLKAAGAFTIELWFKPASTSVLTYLYASQPGPVHFLYQNNATIVFGVNVGAATVTSGNILTIGQWSYLVGVYDGTNLILYQNGAVVAGPSAGQAPNATGITNMSIGGLYSGTGPTNSLNGASISDVAFYGKGLTATQVSDHYQKGRSGQRGAYPALVIDDGGGPGSQHLWYWRFGEPAGVVNSIVIDQMARNYVAAAYTGYAAAGALANDPDTALSFNGTNQYFDEFHVADSPAMQSGPWSFEFWFKSTVTTSVRQYLVSRDNGGTSTVQNIVWYALLESNGVLTAGVQSAAGVYKGINSTKGVVMGDGKWHHVIFTMSADSKTITLFLDGALDISYTDAASIAPYALTGVILVGANANGPYWFSGNIDELAIYDNVALSAAQAAAHYAAGIGRRFGQSGARQAIMSSRL